MTVIGYAFYSTFALTEKDKLMLKKILLLALLPAIAFAEELPAPVKAIEKQGITIIKTFDARPNWVTLLTITKNCRNWA